MFRGGWFFKILVCLMVLTQARDLETQIKGGKKKWKQKTKKELKSPNGMNATPSILWYNHIVQICYWMKHMLILCSCIKNGLFNICSSAWCWFGATSVVRASPSPHHQTPLFIKSCSRIAQILLLSSVDGPFCSGHFTPFKSFLLLWIWTVTSTRPDVRT
jgi:hypothetical protein